MSTMSRNRVPHSKAFLCAIGVVVASSALGVRADAQQSLKEQPDVVHVWPSLAQVNRTTPLSSSAMACTSMLIPQKSGGLSACATFDRENLFVRLSRQDPAEIEGLSVSIAPTPYGNTPSYVVKRQSNRTLRSWESAAPAASVHACAEAPWCQLIVIPLSDILIQAPLPGATFSVLVNDAVARPPDTSGKTPDPLRSPVYVFTADFSSVNGIPYNDKAWARVTYGTHVGPPSPFVTPNPAPVGAPPLASPGPANAPIMRRPELEAHAFDSSAGSPLYHFNSDMIVGQSAIILAPDRSSITNVVQPSSAFANVASALIQCVNCLDYRARTAPSLQWTSLPTLIDPKIDTSALGIDDLLYDATTPLGPFDSSLTLSRTETVNDSYSYFHGASQFHGTATAGFVFNDFVLNAGRSWGEAHYEIDAYLAHVVTNHGGVRASDTGAFTRYVNTASGLTLAGRFATQYAPGSQWQTILGGFKGINLTSGGPKADFLVGWQDSGSGFNPPDGTADPLYGTRGPFALLHVSSDGNARGFGAMTVDAYARRASDSVAVRRSNVGINATLALSNLYSVAVSVFNKPSAGSVLVAEGLAPTPPPGATPSPTTLQFLDSHFGASRTSAQLKYSTAALVTDPAVLDHALVEASLGWGTSRTTCQIRQEFSCAAFPLPTSELTGSFYLLTPGRQFIAYNHNSIGTPSIVSRAPVQTITDGYLLATAVGRCGSAYFGSQNVFGSGDPAKNGRLLLGSFVWPFHFAGRGQATALRVEYRHREPFALQPDNKPRNDLNVQLVTGTANYYGVPDLARCTGDIKSRTVPQ